jgi:hypothetical protein
MLRAEVFVVAPEAPSGLTLTSPPGALPAFTWMDTSKSAQSFSLERSTTATFDPGTVATLAVNAPGIGPGPVVATDNTAAPGRIYFYRVRAEKVLTTPAIPGVTYPAYSAFTSPISVVTSPLVSPLPLAFGNVVYGAQKSLAVTVTNPSSSSFTMTGVSLNGANAGDFTLGTNTCTGTLTGGASCTINVTFKPTALGGRTANLVIANAFTQNAVPMTGTGLSAISITPTALTFSDTLNGAGTPPQVVTIRNLGTTAVTMAVTNSNTADYAMTTSTCTSTLAAGATCTYNVYFKPRHSGVLTSVFNFTFSSPGSPVAVTATGTGVAPIATVNPSGLNFYGPYQTATAAQTLTITNTGTSPLTVQGFSISFTNPDQFRITGHTCGTLPATLAVGASCTVSAQFLAGLDRSIAYLNVLAAAPANMAKILLQGFLTDPSFGPTTGSLTFPSTTVGSTSAPLNLIVRNTGTMPVTIAGLAFSGTYATSFSQTSNCIGTLAAGGSCTVAVTFKPQAAGSLSGTLTITPGLPLVTTKTVNVRGTGL